MLTKVKIKIILNQINVNLDLATGTSADMAKDNGVPLTYTIELRDEGRYGFLLPEEQVGTFYYQAFIYQTRP